MSRIGTWIETTDHKIVEVTAETEVSCFGRLIDQSEVRLRYGEMVEIQNEDILDDDI